MVASLSAVWVVCLIPIVSIHHFTEALEYIIVYVHRVTPFDILYNA